MDLLSQYKQEHPESFEEKQTWTPPNEYGFFIRLVMRASGGKIRDVNTASRILLGAVVIMILVAFMLSFWGSGGSVPPPPPAPL